MFIAFFQTRWSRWSCPLGIGRQTWFRGQTFVCTHRTTFGSPHRAFGHVWHFCPPRCWSCPSCFEIVNCSWNAIIEFNILSMSSLNHVDIMMHFYTQSLTCLSLIFWYDLFLLFFLLDYQFLYLSSIWAIITVVCVCVSKHTYRKRVHLNKISKISFRYLAKKQTNKENSY